MLATTGPEENLVTGKLDEQALQHAHEFVEDVAAKIHALGHSTRSANILGTPAAMIVQQAEKMGSDLIMMGSRGGQGVTRFF